ncbi:Diacylglycerol O-acyltransferase 2 [Podochytrium sp. JEL0797]|nr:Diacylglycerol O-acyltransferase 2 [Podochytrium sp. JEL0797]
MATKTSAAHERLLQFHTIVLWILVPFVCISIVIAMLLISNLTRAIAVLYILYIYFDKTQQRGNRGVAWMRNSAFWRMAAKYYPVSLHKTANLPPNKTYVMGYHPHGVICVGCHISFGCDAMGVKDKFPGVDIHPGTLDMNFMIPGFRELLLGDGYISCSKKALDYSLEHGQSVVLVVGGAQEALDAIPGTNKLVLKKRFGFVKLALRHGSSLVPVFGFGENDLWNQVDNSEGTFVRKFQEFVKGVIGASPLLIYGRFGGVPFRKPVNVVVGAPIECPRIENPSEEVIQEYHGMYVAVLQKLYEDHKDAFSPQQNAELIIN